MTVRLLDVGCGPNCRPGYMGIDRTEFPGVGIVRDICRGLPFDDNSVDGIHCVHVLEHLNGEDLIFAVEEFYRVSKPGVQWTIVVPDATSPNRYRDPTHVTRDWHADSLMLWEVNMQGEHLIFVGPAYGRKAKLAVKSAINCNKDRLFEVMVLK